MPLQRVRSKWSWLELLQTWPVSFASSAQTPDAGLILLAASLRCEAPPFTNTCSFPYILPVPFLRSLLHSASSTALVTTLGISAITATGLPAQQSGVSQKDSL